MTPIYGINQLIKALQIKNHDGASRVKKSEPITKEARLDSLDLSEVALSFHNLQVKFDSIPDVRHEKVADVKDKVKEGYYNRREVVEEVAKAIIKTKISGDFEIARKVIAKTKGQTDVKTDNVERARQRVEDDFYFTDRVKSVIAQKLSYILNRNAT